MVNVAVGDPNLLQGQTQLFDSVEQHLQIATGVDDSGLQRFVAPDQRAVLLEGGDGDGLVVEHGGDYVVVD